VEVVNALGEAMGDGKAPPHRQNSEEQLMRMNRKALRAMGAPI
jgi:hypothetical protein